ncbi:MAG TPA: 50S ribosomal protein L24 [Pirellulales bacterium]|jgi:large subunit ribosomal protein L24|nr:50S ribosomal protein L24 [Pirellulales bacterium]
MHIRVGDTVEVIAGNDRGSRGKVLKLSRASGKLIVEGMNRVFKHMRRSQKNPQGGRLQKEMPIQLSNVMLVCSACGKPSRTGSRRAADGSKERYCKRCSAAIGRIAPAKANDKQKPAKAQAPAKSAAPAKTATR